MHPERARERRDVVLATMRELGMLDAAAVERARREPVRAMARTRPGQIAPYFTDLVREELEDRFGHGARVVTTLDGALQRFAEVAVASGLDQLESRYPRLRRPEARDRLQAALVAIDPATGEIKALVGGRDYQASQFDRATLARRQPGSAFKPFVYLAALRPRDGAPAFTAASIVEDAPVTVTTDGTPWTPRNFEDRYEGRVRVRRALEESLNAATVRIAQAVGLPAVVETARTLGLTQPLSPVPAIALGAFEVTPLDLARAYVPLASGGVRPGAIRAIHAVYERDGAAVVSEDEPAAQAVISPAEAYLMTSLLRGVITSGTAIAAQSLGVRGDLAGKTGTTNDARDAWFVGYSSRLVAAVWVGFDDNQVHGLTGAQAALPIWARFMKQALDAYPAPEFPIPEGIHVARIDATNGKLAVEGCPVVVEETFLAGTEPPPCDEHRGLGQQIQRQIEGWWNKFRGWFGR